MQFLDISVLSIKAPDVREKHPRDSIERTLSSNCVFTVWAVFGGFILHFLLCNYLNVLLTPSYEEPVDTAADIIERNIKPILWPGGESFKQFFAASPDPNYHEISRRFVIAKDWDEYFGDLQRKVISTGMYAAIGSIPWNVPKEEFDDWYRSSEGILGDFPYSFHLSNKKWQLKKVL